MPLVLTQNCAQKYRPGAKNFGKKCPWLWHPYFPACFSEIKNVQLYTKRLRHIWTQYIFTIRASFYLLLYILIFININLLYFKHKHLTHYVLQLMYWRKNSIKTWYHNVSPYNVIYSGCHLLALVDRICLTQLPKCLHILGFSLESLVAF